MTTGYSQTPKLLKGALIYFGAPMLIPIPNIIVFQYNPETMSRTLSPWQPPSREAQAARNGTDACSPQQRHSLSQPYDPAEEFSLVLELDATDALENPDKHPVATLTGVADRLAAIEMLMYPPTGSLLGDLMPSVASSVAAKLGLSGASAQIEDRSVPIVLFFWGPGRIVPVRITSLQVEEQQYSPTLYPLRAKATLQLKVLNLDDLATVTSDSATRMTVGLAKVCYIVTRGQKEALATANLDNSVESIIGWFHS